MYEYKLWGAQLFSDQELDLSNAQIKRQLVEAKMQIDKNNTVTTRFVIHSGELTAYCDVTHDFFRTEFNYE
jgi:hypothetical protein